MTYELSGNDILAARAALSAVLQDRYLQAREDLRALSLEALVDIRGRLVTLASMIDGETEGRIQLEQWRAARAAAVADEVEPIGTGAFIAQSGQRIDTGLAEGFAEYFGRPAPASVTTDLRPRLLDEVCMVPDCHCDGEVHP